jgi:hypothetical protein
MITRHVFVVINEQLSWGNQGGAYTVFEYRGDAEKFIHGQTTMGHPDLKGDWAFEEKNFKIIELMVRGRYEQSSD